MGGSTKKRSSSTSNSKSMWNSSKAKKKKSTSGINETAATKLFAEIADPDDPNAVNMEGEADRCRDVGFQEQRIGVALTV